MTQLVVGARKPEERLQEGQRLLQARLQLVDSPAQLLLDLQGVVPVLDVRVRAQDLQQRFVGRGLPVGDAVPGEPDHLTRGERRVKLEEQARLAHTGLTHDAHDLATSRLGTREAVAQQVDLSPSADERGEAALGADLHSAAPPPPPGHPVRVDGLALSLDREEAERLAPDVVGDQSVGGFRDQDRARLGEGLHAGREMSGVAHRRVVPAKVVADPADDDQPGVQSQAHVHFHALLALELRAVPADRLLDRQGRLDRPEGVVLQRHRRAEERHEAVPEVLVDGSLVAVDGGGHQPQHLVQDPMHELGADLLGEPGRIGEVGEQHGQLLALPLLGAARGQAALGEVRRSVGGRRRARPAGRLRRRLTRPHQHLAVLVDGHPARIHELGLEVGDVLVVEIEASLEGPIRYSLLLAQEVDHLDEEFVECHRTPP